MKYSTILIYKYPNQEWSIVDENYETLEWLSNTTKPTKQELDAQWSEVESLIEAQKEAQAYARANALAKLASLGLTEEDLKALGL
jgi:hypothetical protein